MNLRYTECLDVMPAGYEEAHAVYSNRSLAYAKVSCRLNECRQTRHAEQTNKTSFFCGKRFFLRESFIYPVSCQHYTDDNNVRHETNRPVNLTWHLRTPRRPAHWRQSGIKHGGEKREFPERRRCMHPLSFLIHSSHPFTSTPVCVHEKRSMSHRGLQTSPTLTN